MGQNTLSGRESQEYRLRIKTLSQQMKNLAMTGAGISPWEADVLVDSIEDVYFTDPALKAANSGQLKYVCVSASEPPGKKIEDCEMRTVILTLFADDDEEELSYSDKDASIEKRRRRLLRVSEEAKEQEGLLTQEDLSKILMSNVRTIRRDIKDLKDLGIIVPTRGTTKDIGPGVTHRGMAVKLWIEGKEPTEIARHIKHSLKAVENYLEKFKRVVYLNLKNFSEFEIARTIGISVSAVRMFTELYKISKKTGLFKNRLQEIEMIGAQFYQALDEKKDLRTSNSSTKERQTK